MPRKMPKTRKDVKLMSQNIDISSWSKQKRMDFIKTLNECMKGYENNTERAVERSDRAEWNTLKSDKTKRMSKTEYTKINKGREGER